MGKILSGKKDTTAEDRITQKFTELRSKACPIELPYDIANDAVAYEISCLKDSFNVAQDEHYRGVKYHVFHCRQGEMDPDSVGRFNGDSVPREAMSFGSEDVPTAGEYGRARGWLLDTNFSARGSGRSYAMAVAFLERGLHFLEVKIRYFDHSGGRNTTKEMYDRLRDLTWDNDTMKRRYMFNRDIRGDYFVVSRSDAAEIVLGR